MTHDSKNIHAKRSTAFACSPPDTALIAVDLSSEIWPRLPGSGCENRSFFWHERSNLRKSEEYTAEDTFDAPSACHCFKISMSFSMSCKLKQLVATGQHPSWHRNSAGFDYHFTMISPLGNV